MNTKGYRYKEYRKLDSYLNEVKSSLGMRWWTGGYKLSILTWAVLESIGEPYWQERMIPVELVMVKPSGYIYVRVVLHDEELESIRKSLASYIYPKYTYLIGIGYTRTQKRHLRLFNSRKLKLKYRDKEGFMERREAVLRD
jgi:hypothetical protein